MMHCSSSQGPVLTLISKNAAFEYVSFHSRNSVAQPVYNCDMPRIILTIESPDLGAAARAKRIADDGVAGGDDGKAHDDDDGDAECKQKGKDNIWTNYGARPANVSGAAAITWGRVSSVIKQPLSTSGQWPR